MQKFLHLSITLHVHCLFQNTYTHLKNYSVFSADSWGFSGSTLNTHSTTSFDSDPVTDALTAHALTYADTSCFSVDWIMLRVHEYRTSRPWVKFTDNGEDQENHSSPASVRLMILMPPRHF